MDTRELIHKAKQYIASEKHPVFRKQVEDLLSEENYQELQDRFYTDLVFGTGGLRGVIGGGYNRMNPFVVSRATQGRANYIKKSNPSSKNSCVIAFDSRHYSDLFALEAALVLCANGITTYLFTSLRPTPELSFAVRKLGATSGIVVTASHNPPEYNVYWSDGGQVVPPEDQGIIQEVLKVASDIKTISKDEALTKKLLVMIDKEIDEPFLAMVKRQVLRPELVRKHGSKVKIVYTPLHGTGRMMVENALTALGISVITVPEQSEPDGDFPTVAYPNPEEASAMKLALDLAEKEKAHIVMGTDPDADRLGIAVRGEKGFVLITGNQLGALLADYIFSTKQELSTMPLRPAFVKTIVTTELQRKIAEKHGVLCFDVLTGFKYIAEKIRQFETMPHGPHFLLGDEESYGFLVHTEARDKDAVTAAVLSAEMTLYHLSRNKSVLDRLRELYYEFGYYREVLISGAFKGETGLKAMKDLMERLRTDPPKTFAGSAVLRIKDYSTGVSRTLIPHTQDKPLDLPRSDVLQFVLEDESIISVRPSGTEPKIKFYVSCKSEAGLQIKAAEASVDQRIRSLEGELRKLIGS